MIARRKERDSSEVCCVRKCTLFSFSPSRPFTRQYFSLESANRGGIGREDFRDGQDETGRTVPSEIAGSTDAPHRFLSCHVVSNARPLSADDRVVDLQHKV